MNIEKAPYVKDGFLLIPDRLLTKSSAITLFPKARWSGKRRAWYLSDSPESRREVERVMKVPVLTSFSSPTPPPETEHSENLGPFFHPRTEPRKHQKKALAVCGGREFFGYTMDPGTGKTKVTIDDAQMLWAKEGLTAVGVLCPKSVIFSWLDEIRTHGLWEDWAILRWGGMGQGVVTEYCPTGRHPQMTWLLMSVDSVRTKNGYRAMLEHLVSGKSMLVVDESTRVKNAKSGRTKKVLKLRPFADFRRILTGTLVANTHTDIYAQMEVLDSSIFGGMSEMAFIRHFSIMGGYRGKQVLAPFNEEELAEIVGKHTFRVTLDECTDLPERVHEKRTFTLGEKARGLYKKVQEQVVVELDSGRLTATQVITKIAKLRQITGGWVLDDSGSLASTDDNKKGLLLEVLDEFKPPATLVWCVYRHEVLGLQSFLSESGHRPGVFYGGMSHGQREVALDDFRRGVTNVLILQVDTGGVGLTLNEASLAIFYSNAHLPETRKQAERRNLRIGQTKTTVVVDLIAENTVDESILKSVQGKLDLAEALLDRASRAQVLSPETEKLWEKL